MYKINRIFNFNQLSPELQKHDIWYDHSDIKQIKERLYGYKQYVSSRLSLMNVRKYKTELMQY